MKTRLLAFMLLLWAGSAFAQTPQKQKPVRFDPPTEIGGFKVRYATLSKGKYQEIFTNDTIQRIGAVYFNRVTGEIVGEVVKDSLYYPAGVSARWWSPDPLAGKFAELSPYVFVANNPIKYIDPDGRDIVLAIKSEKAWSLYKNIVNEGMQGQFQVTFTRIITAKEVYYQVGLKATECGGDVGKMTAEGQAFYKHFSAAVQDHKNIVKQTLVYGKNDVSVGKYPTGELDMADVAQFNQGGSSTDYKMPTGATQQGKLIHETVEQYEKAKAGFVHDGKMDGFPGSHSTAISAENTVNGNIRNKIDRLVQGNSWVVQSYTEKNGSITTTLIHLNVPISEVIQLRPKGLPRNSK